MSRSPSRRADVRGQGVVSRRVVGSFRPDHLDVSVDLLHQLPQTIRFLLINGPYRVLCSWKGVWEGDLAKIP